MDVQPLEAARTQIKRSIKKLFKNSWDNHLLFGCGESNDKVLLSLYNTLPRASR